MNFAFEITQEDIGSVLWKHFHVNASDSLAEEVYDSLELDSATAAALNAGTDMDDQTSAAHEEIAKLIKEKYETRKKKNASGPDTVELYAKESE